jgi:SAM-dependent methyltransferase
VEASPSLRDRAELEGASRRLLDEQWFAWVAPLVKDCRVLLCGAVENPPDYLNSFALRTKEAGPRQLVGVDIQPNPYPEFLCLPGNMESVDLGGPYDVVLVPKAFNHVGNPERFLTNVHRALAPGGLLVIKTPCAGSLQLLLTKLTGRMERTDYANPRHIVWHERQSLESLLAASGYQIVEHLSVQSRCTWKQRILWFLVWFRPDLAEDLLMICRRYHSILR